MTKSVSRGIAVKSAQNVGPPARRRRNVTAKEREGKSNEPSITRRTVQFRSCFALGVFGAHASFAPARLQYDLAKGSIVLGMIDIDLASALWPSR